MVRFAWKEEMHKKEGQRRLVLHSHDSHNFSTPLLSTTGDRRALPLSTSRSCPLCGMLTRRQTYTASGQRKNVSVHRGPFLCTDDVGVMFPVHTTRVPLPSCQCHCECPGHVASSVAPLAWRGNALRAAFHGCGGWPACLCVFHSSSYRVSLALSPPPPPHTHTHTHTELWNGCP